MAFFDPEVGDRITVDGKTFSFVENLKAPGMVHAQEGGFGYIFHMMNGSKEFALKQFKPDRRKPDVVVRNQQIAKLRDQQGLKVVDRSIVLPNSELTKLHPDLVYSIIMPWIRGKTWSNHLSERLVLSPIQCLNLAKALITIITSLEEYQAAHCDLSSGNFVVEDESYQNIQLIDVEDIFSKEFVPPSYKILGSPGYAPDWIKNLPTGTYCAEGDRFAGAILLSEILCWQFYDVRQAAFSESSYFQPNEIGTQCDRFRLLLRRLGELNPSLADLLNQVWSSKSLESCPKLSMWKEAIDQIGVPSLVVSPTMLDFGSIDLSSANLNTPTKQIILHNFENGPAEIEVRNEPWIKISTSKLFTLKSGEQKELLISLSNDHFTTQISTERRIEKCLTIISNGCNFDIYASFDLCFPNSNEFPQQSVGIDLADQGTIVIEKQKIIERLVPDVRSYVYLAFVLFKIFGTCSLLLNVNDISAVIQPFIVTLIALILFVISSIGVIQMRKWGIVMSLIASSADILFAILYNNPIALLIDIVIAFMLVTLWHKMR